VSSSPGCADFVAGRENPPLGHGSRGHRTPHGLNLDLGASGMFHGVFPFVWDLAVLQSGSRNTVVPTQYSQAGRRHCLLGAAALVVKLQESARSVGSCASAPD
jgi:hypothetical protein